MIRRLLCLWILVGLFLAPSVQSAKVTGEGSNSSWAMGLVWTVPLVAGIMAYDEELAEGFSSEGLRLTAGGITLLGDGVTGLLIAGGLREKNPQGFRDTLEAMAISGAVTFFLKNVIGRERPYASGDSDRFHGWSPGRSEYHSFPSGHAGNAFALAHVFASHYPEYKAWFYAAALLVGWSRVQLDMHWPSDVVAGAIVGLAGAEFVLRFDRPLFCWTF